MCKDGPKEAQIFGPFCASKWVKIQVFDYFVTCFLWTHIGLTLNAHCSYFQRCMQYGPQRPNIWAILDPKISQKSGLLSHSQNVFHWIHISVTSHAHCKYFQQCVGLRGPILGPQTSQNSGLWSFSQKNFTSTLLHMLIASTFRCVENMGRRGLIFGPLWTPK